MNNKEEPIERFNPDVNYGLTNEQVQTRIKQKLTNQEKSSGSKSYTRIIVENVCTFFNFMWLAIFIALICVKSYNNLLFMFVIVSNTLIAIIQECKAKRTVAKLQLVCSPKINVMRDGKIQQIDTKDIVLDDIIILENGNQVPTDSEIVDGTIEVNESLLTGESVPVKKQNGEKILAGSFLTSGKCFCHVIAVGAQNYISSVAKEAKKVNKPQSNLFKDLRRLTKIIGFFVIPLGVLMFINNFYGQNTDIQTAIVKTCGSLTGIIPAGMFLLVSVALAVGVIKLSKKKTLVQDLYSIEMLARTNVLCLDKTGTITDGTMQVTDVVKLNNTDFDIDKIIKSINCCQPTENATSIAIKKFYGEQNVLSPLFNIPFSSDRKQTITSFENLGTFSFGAYEYINKKEDKKLKAKISKYSNMGYRVLVLAYNKTLINDDKQDLTFEPIAMLIIEDHIRPDAPQTIKWFKDNGVQVKIISGDNPQTVASIASKVGVNNADKYISLENMPLKDVEKIANSYTVFGRVSPEQKLTIVKALKKAGNVVAMTGDGVNDTLALKESDCSIAMADGSDVARSISSLVLMDSKFSSLPAVVGEGRQVINNVQKSSSLFLMKSIFTIVLSLISLCTFTLYPFAPAQILPMETFVIGIPSFLLSLEPNKEQIKGQFLTNVLKISIPYAVILLVNAGIILLFDKLGYLGYGEFNTLATLSMTLVSFLILAKICFPINWYRMAIIGQSVLGISLEIFLLPEFFYITDASQIVYMILTLICSIVAITILCWIIAEKIIQKKRQRNFSS